MLFYCPITSQKESESEHSLGRGCTSIRYVPDVAKELFFFFFGLDCTMKMQVKRRGAVQRERVLRRDKSERVVIRADGNRL